MPTPYQKFLIEHVQKSIAHAQLEISKLSSDILSLEGMSSNKIRHFLNNICSLPDGKYLEIGVWKGSTFIASLYENKLTNAIAIDNWSEFHGPKEDFQKNITKFLPATSHTFYETDCFNFDVNTIPQKINIYFYDAGHTRVEQRLAFVHYNQIFEDTFIAIVDNYNWTQVQEGTQMAFKELQYNVLFEQFLASDKRADAAGWWTGIYVAVISKN
jgi:hypothetical protein